MANALNLLFVCIAKKEILNVNAQVAKIITKNTKTKTEKIVVTWTKMMKNVNIKLVRFVKIHCDMIVLIK